MRESYDLRKLPAWLKYLISLMVIALVVAAARIFGSGEPAPNWILHRLVPVLGWLYLALVAYLLIYYIVRRLRK